MDSREVLPRPRVRIVSDGTPRGTTVYDALGNPLPFVTAVTWRVSVDGERASATIEVSDVAVMLGGFEITNIHRDQQAGAADGIAQADAG